MNRKEMFSNFVVGSTTDYGKFKIVASNRSLKRSNVANLMKSFKITGGMCKSHPIIVDRSLNVIDGQHRLEACKKMGIPVHYIISEDRIETIPVFNAYQEKWGLEDYARYFSQNGNKNYEKILQVKDSVGIGINAILESLGKPTGKAQNSSFKEGRFVFYGSVEDSVTIIKKMLKLCYLVKKHHSVSSKIARAVKFLSRIKDFDLDEFIAKVEKYPSKIYSCGTREEYIEMFINIHNWHRKKEDGISAMDIIVAKKEEEKEN